VVLTTGKIAIYIAQIFDISQKLIFSLGIVQDFLIISKLATSTIAKDVSIKKKFLLLIFLAQF
jgi:hypothetical protein